jgi:hypothetical protein
MRAAAAAAAAAAATKTTYSLALKQDMPNLNGLPTTVKYIRMFVSFSANVSGQQACCVTELPLFFLLLFDDGAKPY